VDEWVSELNPFAPLGLACLILLLFSGLAVSILMGFHMIWNALTVYVIVVNVALVILCFRFYRILRARRSEGRR
jgi:cytochrome c oxidase subunit IV